MVHDTNVLLSGIAYPGSVPGKLIAARRHGTLNVVLSDDILDELRRVLPKLAHRHAGGVLGRARWPVMRSKAVPPKSCGKEPMVCGSS